MSGSRIIIADEDRLANVHPGDILREDFLIGSEISAAEVVAGAGIDPDVFAQILASEAPIDAEMGLRLSRYFGMNDGFFVGLQMDYDLEEAWLAKGAELDRIVPRAA